MAAVLIQALWLTGDNLAIPDTLSDDKTDIEDNKEVDQRQGNLEWGHASNDFVELPGQERCGENQGEVLRPDLFIDQPDPFNDVECGIQEESEGDLPEAAGT